MCPRKNNSRERSKTPVLELFTEEEIDDLLQSDSETGETVTEEGPNAPSPPRLADFIDLPEIYQSDDEEIDNEGENDIPPPIHEGRDEGEQILRGDIDFNALLDNQIIVLQQQVFSLTNLPYEIGSFPPPLHLLRRRDPAPFLDMFPIPDYHLDVDYNEHNFAMLCGYFSPCLDADIGVNINDIGQFLGSIVSGQLNSTGKNWRESPKFIKQILLLYLKITTRNLDFILKDNIAAIFLMIVDPNYRLWVINGGNIRLCMRAVQFLNYLKMSDISWTCLPDEVRRI